MVHSDLIPEHDNILSYHYHVIEVSGLNPGSGSKPGDRQKDLRCSGKIMRGYVR